MRNAPALHARDHLPGGADPLQNIEATILPREAWAVVRFSAEFPAGEKRWITGDDLEFEMDTPSDTYYSIENSTLPGPDGPLDARVIQMHCPPDDAETCSPPASACLNLDTAENVTQLCILTGIAFTSDGEGGFVDWETSGQTYITFGADRDIASAYLGDPAMNLPDIVDPPQAPPMWASYLTFNPYVYWTAVWAGVSSLEIGVWIDNETGDFVYVVGKLLVKKLDPPLEGQT